MSLPLGKVFVDIVPNMSKFAATVSGAMDANAARLGKSGRRIGATMSRGITAPVLIGMGLSIKAFGNFDATIRQVGVSVDAQGPALERMSKLALQLGQDTVFSANDAAKAMLALAKGGMTQAEIEAGVLAETLTLAAAGGLELDEAARTMVNTLSAFGLAAKDADRVAAALAAADLASTASVQSLSQGLSQVGAGAVNAGMGVNETIAALALFEKAGVKGSDAGTSLKTMLASLTPTTAKAADAMEKYNLDFTNADGSMKSMAEVAGLLHSELGPLDEATRNVAMKTIFGSDATRAASILMRAGKEDVIKMTAATRDLEAAQKMATEKTKGQKGSFEQMTGSIDTAAVAIGKTLSPHVTALADKITELANEFSSLNPETQKTILAVAGIAAVAGPAVYVVGSLVTVLGWINGAAGLVVAGAAKIVMGYRAIQWNAAAAGTSVARYVVASIVGSVTSAAAAVVSAAVQVGALVVLAAKWTWAGAKAIAAGLRMAAAWLLALGPIGLIIAAVAVAVLLIIKYWDKIKPAFAAVGNFIQKYWRGLLILLLGPLGLAVVLIVQYWDKIKAGFMAAVNFIREHWRAFLIALTGPVGLAVVLIVDNWNKIKAAFAAVGAGISAAWRATINAIKSAFFGAVNFIKAHWRPILVVLTGPIGVAVILIVKHWAAIKAQFFSMLAGIRGAWPAISRFLQDPVRVGVAAIKSIAAGIPGFFRAAASKVGSAFSPAWGAIKSGASDAAGVVRGVFADLVSWVKGALTFTIRIPSKVASLARLDSSYTISAFADGGTLPAGEVGLVGERGPEFITGGARGSTIMPMQGKNAVSMRMTITNWNDGTGYIEAVAGGVMESGAAHARQSARMNR